MAKSVDAADLKSASPGECGFKSRRPHPALTHLLPLLLLPATAGCTARADDAPAVSVIGPAATDQGPGPASTVLRRATAQGLVRLDEAGVVTPGLAERWIVLDDGLTVIFRLADTDWADGRPVRSAAVRDALRRILARPGDSATVAAAARAIDRVNAVIPSILEVKLTAQRPDLLALLAQPEFALAVGGGSGPLRPHARDRAGWRTLSPVGAAAEDGVDAPATGSPLRLRGEPAARALARYAAGDTDIVLGGRIGDLPLAQAAASAAVAVDPADGLFGLRVRRRDGLIADAAQRHALAMALDRPALVAAFGVAGWEPADGLLPGPGRIGFDWAGLSAEDRVALARARVARWRADHPGEEAEVSVAAPGGPGGRLLLAWLARQWTAIGVRLTEATAARAQLDWVDAVAPSSDPAATMDLVRCGRPTPCGPDARDALTRLAAQPTLAAWRRTEREAEAALVADLPVLPIARPLRWSVVRAGVPGIAANPRAIHPLTPMLRIASPSR